MKKPDKIKKGLGWCSCDTTLCTETCPYYGPLSNGVDCANELKADALVYIQQLEVDNAELLKKTEQLNREKDRYWKSMNECCYTSRCNATIKELRALCNNKDDQIEQLERERDALLEIVRNEGDCQLCKYANPECNGDCAFCEQIEPCVCVGCTTKNSHWEWAGIKEDNP